MIELEKTFLAKYLPEDLKDSDYKEIIDVLLPVSAEHPKLRIRKRGDKFEMTKKEPINPDDASEQKEQTIVLSPDEFNAFANIESKKLRKFRYYYKYNGRIAEIDVFQDDLKGLVVIEFEFDSSEEIREFHKKISKCY